MRSPETIVGEFDSELVDIEDEALKGLEALIAPVIVSAIKAAGDRYKRILETEGDAWIKEALARDLAKQVTAVLQSGFANLPSAISPLIPKIFSIGSSQASRLLDEFGTSPVIVEVQGNILDAVLSNTRARLLKYGSEFSASAEKTILEGISKGYSYQKVARNIKQSTGALYSRLEQMVRTESVQISDAARRDTYRRSGIEYVQRVATQDTRVCRYCAARAGYVYRIEEAPAALHPSCRCFNQPFKKEWIESGLIKDDWYISHRKSVIARAESVSTGAAPFEKAAGRPPPKPVYIPGRGWA